MELRVTEAGATRVTEDGVQREIEGDRGMTTQQGLRQASARAIAGTALTYNGDMRAMFEAEATIPAGATYNGAMILWLQARLSSSDTNLPGLMAAFAAAEGAHGWSSLGSFDPAA